MSNSRNPGRTRLKPQILVEETFDKTKKFVCKTFRNLKSFVLGECKKLSFPNPIFSGGGKIDSRVQELDEFCRSFSEQWKTNEALKKKEEFLSPKEQKTVNEQCKKSSISVSQFEESEEEKNTSDFSAGKLERLGSMAAADSLAKKMKDLEMMDVNDRDHVQDIEEVLQSYSRLTCPAYLEMVDKFFMDMYLEYRLPMPTRSVNGSLRKLGSGSVHGSTRNVGSGSVHSSMRSLGPVKI